jgi:hypothetical protein
MARESRAPCKQGTGLGLRQLLLVNASHQRVVGAQLGILQVSTLDQGVLEKGSSQRSIAQRGKQWPLLCSCRQWQHGVGIYNGYVVTVKQDFAFHYPDALSQA